MTNCPDTQQLRTIPLLVHESEHQLCSSGLSQLSGPLLDLFISWQLASSWLIAGAPTPMSGGSLHVVSHHPAA